MKFQFGLFPILWTAGCCTLAAGTYGNLPLSFEANQGRTDSKVRYIARGQGYALFLTPTEAVLRLARDKHSQSAGLTMRLPGAASNPQIEGLDPLPGSSYYYAGGETRRWTTGIPNFARVRYREVYPGIDLIYYGNQQRIEYDFVLAPHANVRSLRMAFDGANRIQLNRQGDLVINVAGGEVRLPKPVAYQDISGARRNVPVSYALNGKSVRFRVGAYDSRLPLIIDPVLSYSSYLGASSLDGASAIAVDSAGNAYIAGWTSSFDFPATTGAPQPTIKGMTDAFVMKINPAGTARLFSTYLGGSANDYAEGIALDPSGNIYVTGSTQSSDFPVLSPLQSYGGSTDAFITKLSPAGTLLFSTFLGGSGNDDAHAIAIDVNGNAYVAGVTDSPNFPVTSGVVQPSRAGVTDAFVVKLNPLATAKLYSTYIGGTSSDEANGIAVDASGNAWITGYTWSTDFPTKSGLQAFGGSVDAFVTELNPTGTSLLFSTFLGGNSTDVGDAIAVDTTGNAYVTGSTSSLNFPTTAGALQIAGGGLFTTPDAFVTKYNAVGTLISYSTLLGGTGDDRGYGIAVDAVGNAYVTGQTSSTNFPVLDNLSSIGLGSDAFVTVLNSTGSALLFSTWLGGSGNETGMGIAADANGRAYVAGLTNSTNFPIRPVSGALQQNPGGGIEEGFVAALQVCDYTLGVTGSPVASAGGNGGLTISSKAGCPWLAASGVSWITFPSGAQGSGSVTVTFTAAANTSSKSRIGILTAGWQSVQPTQSGTPCTFVATPTQAAVLATAGSGSFSFTASPADCDWTATSDSVWLTVTSGASGTGNGNVGFSYLASGLGTSRLGNITINATSAGSKAFPVTQAAAGTSYTISGQVTVGGAGLAGVTVTLAGGASGTRTTDASGNYSFASLAAGVNYTVTPSRANYTFTPASTAINNLASNIIANFSAAISTGKPDKVGTTYSGFSVLDANGNFAWDGPTTDKLISWSTFQAGEKPIYGDWNGDGKTKVGVYNNGTWLLDYNGNGVWDGPTVDKAIFWSTGQSSDVPVLGDWNGDGRTKIGIYNNGTWILDYNGNGVWEGPAVDKTIYWSTGQAGEVPVVGDWNGDGKTKIGIYANGTWILEYNGNYAWDGTGVDKLIYFGGPGYRPMLGDWNGSGWTKIGAYHVNGTWALDYNGNFVWDGTSIDRLTFFGGPEWTPVVGDWSGNGTTKIGAYTGGQWALDYNGNFGWDVPPDRLFSFGAAGQTPIVGKW